MLGYILYTLLRFELPLYIAIMIFGFHLKKRDHFWIRFAIGTLCYIGFCIGLAAISKVHSLRIGWFSFTFLLVFLTVVPTFYICFEVNLRCTLFYAFAAYAVQNLADYIYFFIMMNGSSLHIGIQALVYASVYLVIYVVYYLIFVRKVNYEYLKTLNNRAVYVILVITLGIVYVLSMYGQDVSYNSGLENVKIALSIYAATCCLLLLSFQYFVFAKHEVEDRQAILEKIVHDEKQQYADTLKNIDLINMRCHDIKHQIEDLRKINVDSNQAKLLDELEKNVFIYDTTIHSGNNTIDTILSEKSLFCFQNKITFSSMLDGTQLNFMEDADLYSLFDNIIDNAIEGVENLKENKRIIILNVKAVNNNVVIHEENYCLDDLTFKDGMPVTTKNNPALHGFGTKSIEYVVKKYKGTFAFEKKENKFSLNIMFKIRQKNK